MLIPKGSLRELFFWIMCILAGTGVMMWFLFHVMAYGQAINPQTGQYLPPTGEGVFNPQTGQYYPPTGQGYFNTQTGQYYPSIAPTDEGRGGEKEEEE